MNNGPSSMYFYGAEGHSLGLSLSVADLLLVYFYWSIGAVDYDV